jgi:hypothetical protein
LVIGGVGQDNSSKRKEEGWFGPPPYHPKPGAKREYAGDLHRGGRGC